MEKFSASRAARLMECPGSGDLEKAIPGWEPPAEREEGVGAASMGHFIHDILEKLALARYITPAKPEGTPFNAASYRALAGILMYIAELMDGRRWKKVVEHSLKAEWLPSKPPTTADLVLYTQKEIHVIDYKWGLEEVDTEDNKQMLFYLATYWLKYAPHAKILFFHVLQPRIGQLEAVQVSVTELRAFMADAVAADQRMLDGDLTLQVSDHCKFCPAFPHSRGEKGTPACPAATKLLYPSNYDEDAMLGMV